MADKPLKSDSVPELPESEIASRLDRAIRRSLQMPPTQHKDIPKRRPRKKKADAVKPGTEPA